MPSTPSVPCSFLECRDTLRPRALFLASGSFLLALLGSAPCVEAIPAFARKYGLRCTACHEAWPALNDFGRAFRDNGYQLMLGHDEPTSFAPEYWPVSVRMTPHYEFNSIDNQPTDQGKKKISTGGVGKIGIDLLAGGTLLKDVSFLVVPTGFTTDEGVSIESAWVRFDNLLGSPCLNLKLGKHEVDLPRSAHRPWNLTETGYLIYSYHPSGSASLYDMGENQRGVEFVCHDRGSFNRVAFSAFNVEQSPGSHNAFETPGFYGHATHQFLFDDPWVSAARLGVFAAHTTWPTRFLTSGGQPIPGTGRRLKTASKYGAEGQLWFGPAATPLHLIGVGAMGRDSRELIPHATRHGTFAGGFLELGYTPTLHATFFGRWDVIRNLQQAVRSAPSDLNDQVAYTAGLRYTIGFTSRAEVALHIEFSTETMSKVGVGGNDVRRRSVFLGGDLAF